MTYDEFLNEWRGPSRCITVHTSGSTGTPKRIMLDKEVVRESARRSIDFLGLTARSRLHSCISPDYIGGKMVAVRAEESGALMTYETPSNRPVISQYIDPNGKPCLTSPAGAGTQYYEVDLVSVVPSQMVEVINHPDYYRHVRRWLIGGQALPYGMSGAIERLGLEAWESYGMTETASHVALRRVCEGKSLFYPLAGINLSIDNRDCLVINGVTEEAIVTNDVADLHPDGGFEVIGRADNVIITGGIKVHPERVEQQIKQLTGLDNNIMLTSEPDSKWGSRLKLLIEGLQMSTDESHALLRLLRARLLPAECPKEIEIVDSLPHTPNGKLQRRKFGKVDKYL